MITKAQVAANYRVITILKALISEYSLDVVHAYMGYIRKNAELAVSDLLKIFHRKYGGVITALDFMDDGSPISLKVTIDEKLGTSVFDFEHLLFEMSH